ncbi:MAG: class I SAM-dependent methyltransferase [Chloroflexaceae bacterium]|nr:class I SAM-dependent methyltransferase [Chloroflexaceae bacterium]
MRLYYGLINWAFQRFYNEFAWTYDTVAWLVSRGLWRRWTLAAVPYLRGKVLELGCGTGNVQHTLAIQQRQAVGLDASPFMLALTRRRVQRTGQAAHLLRGVAQRLPFADQRFETVLATFPTSYILTRQHWPKCDGCLSPQDGWLLWMGQHFTSNGLYEGLIDLVYRAVFLASPQEPPRRHPYLDVLEQAGFTVALHPEMVAQSQVYVFVAQGRA